MSEQTVIEPTQGEPAKGRVPKVGDLVLYRMTGHEADRINQRRKDAMDKMPWHLAIRSGAVVHVGNPPRAGQQYPATIVAAWGESPTSCVNLQVALDGNDSLWVTSVNRGNGDGEFEFR